MTATPFEPAAQRGLHQLAADRHNLAALTECIGDLLPHAPREAQLTLAALLEVQGVTDEIARRYAACDVFDLAGQLLPLVVPAIPTPQRPTAPASEPWWRHWHVGPAQAIVMALTFGLLILTERGLGAIGVELNFVFGATFLATIATSAALQASAWLMALASSRGEYRTLRIAVWGPSLAATGAALLLAIGTAGVAGLSHTPGVQLAAMATVCVLLTPLLMFVGIMLLLEQRGAVGFTLAAAVILVGAGFAAFDSPAARVMAGAAGVLGTIAALAGQIALLVRRRGRALNPQKYTLGPAGQVGYHRAPMVCYGALTISLVFGGQVAGWLGLKAWQPEASPASALIPLAGLMGLIVFMLGQGIFEVGMRAIWGVARDIQERVRLDEAGRAGTLFWRFIIATMARGLLAQLGLSATLSVGGLLVAPAIMPAAHWGTALGQAAGISIAGYSLLGHALFACGVLNTLGQRWQVVRALVAATLINAVCTPLALTWWGPAGASAGLIAGAVVLLGLATVELRGLLRRGEHALYQAF